MKIFFFKYCCCHNQCSVADLDPVGSGLATRIWFQYKSDQDPDSLPRLL